MFFNVLRLLATMLIMVPAMVAAETIKLKLSFFTSDRSLAYQAAVKPFVDAVNREGKDLLQIDVYLSGTLGKVQRELPQLVLDGEADIAFIVPGQNPERFTDNAVIELPGLFADVREATLTYSRLLATGSLSGYQDFFVIGAYATQPETIHSRKPISLLGDLKGQTIRTNNPTEAVALAKLGALPVVLAFNETATAISSGALDGATVPSAQLFDVGIGRLTSNHYYLRTSVAPLALMMNRKVFNRLPEEAKNLIRKYSGEWTASHFIDAYEKAEQQVFDQIKSDTRRKVVMPSRADLETSKTAFKSIIDDWIAKNIRNRELFKLTEAELAIVRDPKLGSARAAVPRE
jgi:TRAP-type C4-dicarboxylate transport system substrate-binding protein